MSVTCYDVYGNAVLAEPKDMLYCPAVYGIFAENDRILLVQHPTTQLWHPPGIILQNQQTPKQAIRAHFRQIIQMPPVVKALLLIEERFQIDKNGQPWHVNALYYALERPLLTTAHITEPGYAEEVEWLEMAQLSRKEMQFGYEAIQTCRYHLSL